MKDIVVFHRNTVMPVLHNSFNPFVNMSSPLVSVLVTTYNREKYIAEALESILASTYTNFELIVVDDCSTDSSFSIVKSYAAKDSRIKAIRNTENLGDYGNRNKAAAQASGKYIKYVDADDKIYRHGLEIMVENMERFPDAAFGLASLQQDDNRIFPVCLTPKEAYRRHYLSNESFVRAKKIFNKAPLSAILRRDIFIAENGFNNVRYYGDQDMWHRLARKYPVVLMQDGIVWWRGHEDQEQKVRNEFRVFTIRTWNNVIEHLQHPECPLSPEEVKPIIKKLRLQQYRAIGAQIKKMEFKDAGNMYREMSLPSISKTS